MVDALARVCRLLERRGLQVAGLGRPHDLAVAEDLVAAVQVLVLSDIDLILNVECLRNGVLVVVTGLNARNHRLLFRHAPLVLTVLRGDHRR